MPKYIMCSDDNTDATTLMPDMRGFPKDDVLAMATELKRLYCLPDCVGLRALLRTSDVSFCAGRVVIDDDAVVLHPAARIRFRKELVTRCLSDVE